MARLSIQQNVITASAEPNGSISPSGAVSVNYGADQTFTITPDTGYHVADVLVDGSSVGAVTSYPFTNVIAPHTIVASFAIDTFTIDASAGENGSISPAGAVSANYGTSQTFTFTPDTGYHVATVTVDNLPAPVANSYTFSSISDNHTIAVTFAINTYTLTPSPLPAGSHGTIDPATVVTKDYGTSQTFTFTPDTGYHVATVTVDGGAAPVANSYTFSSISDNHTIAVTFAINTYTLTPSPLPAGSHGTIDPATVVTKDYGTSQTFNFTPDTGYHVATVTVDGGAAPVANSYTFSSISDNHTIAVTFAINTYTLTPSPLPAGSHGTIDPATVVTKDYGTSQTFTFTPDTGYHVATVTVDNLPAPVANSYTFSSISDNHTIAVTFAINTYTLTPSPLPAGSHGTIDPATVVTKDYGTSQTFTFTPDTGYHVATVTVDGGARARGQQLHLQQRHR